VAQAGGRIEAVFYCPHAAEMNCDCRKPKPGLFDEIAARYGRALTDVPAVGDSLRDLQAAASVGARPLLVRTGKGEKTLAAGGLPENRRCSPTSARRSTTCSRRRHEPDPLADFRICRPCLTVFFSLVACSAFRSRRTRATA
jgi:histidinol phosphatase-like enzyme